MTKSTVEALKRYLQEIEENDKKGKKINAFLQINPNALQEAKKIDEKIANKKAGRLAGKIIAVKANINVKGFNTSCASRVLKNYKAPYDASVIEKIKKQDALIIGITNMDEFACGGSGETSAFGATQNPRALGFIPGGSSSGSVAAVAAEFCDMALGSDTGGSIRNPASHCGVVGVKPSYGSVSRYGLIDLAMSLDQIGPIAKNIEDVELLLNVIKGKDERDAISLSFFNDKGNMKNLTIGLLDLSGLKVDEKIKQLVEKRIQEIAKKNNWKIEKVKINYLDLAIATYYLLVYVEFFSGTRKFDGRRYGKRIENAAGAEVLRRILGGSEISKAEFAGRYYHRALKAKKLIEIEFEKAFNKFDCIISPTVPRLPHKIGKKISVEEMYSYDVLTTPANLAGICGVSVPCGEINKLPVGMQILCKQFADEKMLQIAKEFEKD
ncbi:MAG: Asp-tRNA(Asn)/Glu-tRNA(Gln) amidotransferase subunit GatA [Nanoarchaeota archaeon]